MLLNKAGNIWPQSGYLMLPERPFGKGETSLSNAALSMKQPFSSKYVPSSAKYFVHGRDSPAKLGDVTADPTGLLPSFSRGAKLHTIKP
jgi:hypothetical protein